MNNITLPREVVESVAKTIYSQWEHNQGYVRWVDGGNSMMQDKAREIARDALSAAAPAMPSGDLWQVAMRAFQETEDKNESIRDAWERVVSRVLAAAHGIGKDQA